MKISQTLSQNQADLVGRLIGDLYAASALLNQDNPSDPIAFSESLRSEQLRMYREALNEHVAGPHSRGEAMTVENAARAMLAAMGRLADVINRLERD